MNSPFVSLARAAVVSAVFVFSAAPFASAQTPPQAPPADVTAILSSSAFARLVTGKTVKVTKSNGGVIQGRISGVSPAGIAGLGAPVPFDQVMKVEKVTRRVQKGLLIGLGLGTGVGILSWWQSCEDTCLNGFEVATIIGVSTAAGAGLGLLANAIHKHSDVLFDAKRATKTTVAVAPILSPTRKGVAFSMTWR